MNRQWWELTRLVAVREIRDRARARSFWIASVLLLAAVAAGAVVPALLHSKESTARVGITGGQVATLTRVAQEAGRLSGTRVTVLPLPSVAAAQARLKSGNIAAALIGSREILVGKQSLGGSSGGSLPGALAQTGGLEKLYAQLPAADAARLARTGLGLPVRSLTSAGRGLAVRLAGLGTAILIYVIILTYGVRITIGVGEEKASRVVEVLLTTLRPVQLLAGKVIGIGLLALAQIAAMTATFLILGYALGSPAVRGPAATVVPVGALWLLLGYVFYCTAYAAAGALISRQADAYNASLPLQIPLILAYVLSYTVIYANGVNWFYHVLAFIPFTAPVAMPVLAAVGAAPAWEIATSAVITLAGTAVMARLAGTVYERAILRTGTRLRLRQVLRTPG